MMPTFQDFFPFVYLKANMWRNLSMKNVFFEMFRMVELEENEVE